LTKTATKSTRERLNDGERVLSLSEVAERLRMKRPNVAKFLARRGVEPAFPKAQGYFWWESDVERVKAEREADPDRMAADARRRRTAVARAGGEADQEETPPEVDVNRLGITQQLLLQEMLRRPVPPDGNTARSALRRLALRGLAERVPGERVYQLTPLGRRAAAEVQR
jgi:predicted DNA-binding transcriptional regulator AlpA